MLPLDDEELLNRAKPVTPDGRIQSDPLKLEERRDGMVRAAMASGHCSLLILGGNHDLSESVKRLGKGTVEYIRMTTGQ